MRLCIGPKIKCSSVLLKINSDWHLKYSYMLSELHCTLHTFESWTDKWSNIKQSVYILQHEDPNLLGPMPITKQLTLWHQCPVYSAKDWGFKWPPIILCVLGRWLLVTPGFLSIMMFITVIFWYQWANDFQEGFAALVFGVQVIHSSWTTWILKMKNLLWNFVNYLPIIIPQKILMCHEPHILQHLTWWRK